MLSGSVNWEHQGLKRPSILSMTELGLWNLERSSTLLDLTVKVSKHDPHGVINEYSETPNGGRCYAKSTSTESTSAESTSE